ncbi:hypothetical protein M8J77_020430 [Diaphorina citri]|nr:hypothetical protein M8J77_020430 [Diaphorina citri]
MKHRVKRPYGLSQGGAFDMAATKLPRDDRTMQEITMRQHELKHIFKTIVDCAEENNKRGGDPSKFEPYWNYLDVQHGLDKKVLHQGIFHVNPKEKEKGYVTPPCCILGKEDIHIIGLKNRNRAFEGDRVVVKILNTKNWVKDKHKKDAIKPTGRIVYILELNHPRTSMGRIEKLETDRPVACLGFESLDPCVPPIVIIQEFLDWKKKQYDSSPFSSVFYTQAQFLQNLIYYVKITSWMICNVAKGELVDVVGFHQNITGAKLVSLLQRELTSLIDKYRFQFHPYDTKKLKTMNKHFNKEYEAKTYVTEEDMLQRSDLTDQTVFTLSPHDRSPDDTSVAYSIRPLDMGLNEVQVHVSDVATYLSRGGDRPATSGTPGKKLPRAQAEQLKDMYGLLSKTAQYNCISVSTINRRISSLLPAALKKICALVPNEQKLALTFEFVVDKDGTVVSRRFFASLVKSVAHLTYAQVKEVGYNEQKLALTFEFVVDKDGTVVSRRFFASLVKSVAHLTYAQVKKILDNPEDIGWLRSDLTPPPSRSKTKGPAPPPPKPLNLDEIRTSVLEFVRLSRTAMAQAPARLRLTKPEVKFTIVNDVPKRVHVAYGLTELDNLLGHWNFEVEKTAATRLITTFPHSALLVRQPPPDPRLLRVLAEFLAAHQIVLDVSDAPSSLAESWAKIRTQDPACRNLVPVLLVLFDQILQEPEFCTPFRADSKHYSLDEEYMTQFMSPLHNFSHIVVQKQLLMSLQISNSYQDPSLNNAVYIKSLADQHNTLRGEIESLNKKVAEMYLALQLGYGSNCLNCQAIVVAVYESSVDILVPSLYFVTTLYLDDYTVETSMQAGLWVHKVSWSSPPHTQTLTHLTTLPVRFNKCAYNFSVACTLRHPLNQGQDGLCLLVEPQGGQDGLCLLVEPQGGDVEEVPPGFWSQSRMSASDLKALVNAAPVTTPAAKLPSAPAPPTEKPKRQSRAQKKKASAAKANTQSVEAGGNPSKSWFDASKGKPDVSSGATNRINDLLSSEIQMLTLSSSDSELDNETNVTEQREDANVHPPPMFIRPVEGPLPFNIPTPEDKAFKKPTPPSNKPTNNATPLNIDALISAQLQNIAAKPSDATPKTFGETPPTKTYGETSAPRKPSDKTPSSTFGETPSKPSSETFGRLDFTRTKDGVSSTADVSSRASPVSSGVPPVAPRQVTLSSAPYATDPPKYLASQTRETDAGASQRPANLSSPFKTSAAASPAQTSGTMSGPTGISASPTSGPTRTSTSMAGPTNTSSEPTRPTPLSGPTRTSTSMAGPTVTSGSMGAPRSSSYSYTAAELNQQQQRPTNLQTQQQQRPNQQTQQQWRESHLSSSSSSNKKEDNCIIT